MVNHSKVMLLGLLPIVAISDFACVETMQQQSALAFGVNYKKTRIFMMSLLPPKMVLKSLLRITEK